MTPRFILERSWGEASSRAHMTGPAQASSRGASAISSLVWKQRLPRTLLHRVLRTVRSGTGAAETPTSQGAKAAAP